MPITLPIMSPKFSPKNNQRCITILVCLNLKKVTLLSHLSRLNPNTYFKGKKNILI